MDPASVDLGSAERKDVLDGLGRLIDAVAVPLESANWELFDDQRRLYDGRGAYSGELRELLTAVRTESSKAGYYAMFAPEEVGGAGLGPLMQYETWEYLHHRYGPGRLLPYAAVGHWTSGLGVMSAQASDEVKATVVPSLVSGKATACFAMSEPDAGSDAWAMRTSANREEGGWCVSGTKQWITNSPFAQYVFLFAVTDEAQKKAHRGGISCFLVPTEATGFSVDSVIRLFGAVGGNEAILSLQNVHLPETALVGEVDRGFSLALAGVMAGRIYNAGRCIGLARWALERAVEYSKERHTFGRSISEYQGVSFPLADSAIDIYAAKTMALDCASRMESGRPATKELAMLKALSTETCFRVYDRCMQVYGGMGLTNDMRLYDGWHQARILRIADGSAEIMRRNIARALLSGDITI